MYKLLELLKEDTNPAPFMYSPVGFSCAVCEYLIRNKDEDRWVCSNTDYQQYMESQGIDASRSHYLLDPKTKEPIEDPTKWCSNWFEPKQ
jgi:hypothetical protein